MNHSNGRRVSGVMVATAVAAILAACAATPNAPPGSAAVRTKLTTLKSQPQLAAQVPVVLQEAEKAVVLAETPQADAKLASHRVYLADKLVDTARATAEVRLAEAQRAALKQQSDESRLTARTREADAAQRAASAARAEAESSRVKADNARNESERSRVEAENARSQADAVRGATEAARLAEDQRALQKQQSDDARLTARALEVDAAQRAATTARSDAESSRVMAENNRLDSDRVRNEMESARLMSVNARNEADAARNVADSSRLAESQRAGLQQQSEDARVAARILEADAVQRAVSEASREAATQRIGEDNRRIEADRSRNESDSARNQAAGVRNEADAARNTAEAARLVAQAAKDAAASTEVQRLEFARQIVILQGRTTERGIVLTLGDVLFATGSDQLKPGAVSNLDRLAAFMGKYADRSATIEGHTDSVGDERSNEALSQRRADSVKAYLAGKGVVTARLLTTGKGESYPVAGNDSAGGRQQNRRVEVIIDNAMPPVAQSMNSQ